MVQHYCHGVTMDGSQIFKGQWTGQVPVVYVLELLVTTNLMQKRGLRGHQRCKLFCQCILPTMQALVTHPILLISIQIITFIKWDPSCAQAGIDQSTNYNEYLWVWLQLPGTQRVQEFLLTQGVSILPVVVALWLYTRQSQRWSVVTWPCLLDSHSSCC